MSRTFMTLAVALLLILVAACGGDEAADDAAVDTSGDTATEEVETTDSSSDSETVTEETEDDEPTEVAEETEATDEAEPTTEPEETAATGDEPDELDPDDIDTDVDFELGDFTDEDLAAALLTLDDLPDESWEVGGEGSYAGTGSANPDDLASAPCGVEAPDFNSDSVIDAQRTFNSAGEEMFGSMLMHGIAAFESSDDAANVMQSMKDLYSCDEWIEEDQMGETVAWTVDVTSLDGIGDEAVAFTLNMAPEDAGAEMEMFGDMGFTMYAVREGQYFSTLINFDMMGTSELDMNALVARAGEKMGDL